MSETLGITFEEVDRAGMITLDSPASLNALTPEMFDALSEHYQRWTPAPHIYGVVTQSTHPKVFCAGGNLKLVHGLLQAGDFESLAAFYRKAYEHVWVLEKFIRPNVPLINGLCLGGGVGISLLGTHCIAGEGYALGMPQVGIGHVPDSGGTYFLPRLRHQTGVYLALTGKTLSRADAYRLELVSHCIPAAHFHVIADGMQYNHPIDRLLDGLHRDPGEGELARLSPLINEIFCLGSVEEILERLDAEEGPYADWAKETAAEMRKKSPTSLKIALQQMRRGKTLSLDEALKLEYRLVQKVIRSRDYAEGIDARINGKGRPAKWNPETLADVDDKAIDSLFDEPAPEELHLEELTPGL
ncbi:enoyl-CoA hydratase/isomerase family protein [Methyloligella sp. 2.7D]|uniref:enoyl-CoA hydratase/isomerase family protein n=1 Tax=Methyloligella sp. 2.7D TaxID=3085160 RepID=UPI002FD8A035